MVSYEMIFLIPSSFQMGTVHVQMVLPFLFHVP